MSSVPVTDSLGRLIDALQCLPGVGRKTAQRISYHLLERNRDGAGRLAESLREAIERIDNCQRCRGFSETPVCRLCDDPGRDDSLLCVVESPVDIQIIEEIGYRGRYFVLMGRLSPLDGIGPEELGIELLSTRVAGGTVEEVILATNPTVEGEATANFIHELLKKRQVRATRLAQGIPIGGELEYLDSNTLACAFSTRRVL